MIPVIKGRKQSKKCGAYIKRMITCGNWKPNEKIPTISELATTLSVSFFTIRKVIKEFERHGIIENFGSLGFFLIKPNTDKKIRKNLLLTKMLRTNLDAYDMLTNKAKQYENWIVRFDLDEITALYIRSGDTRCAHINEIINTVLNPMTLEQVLLSKGQEYNKRKKIYTRQQELRSLARLVLKHKKELGINVSKSNLHR